MARPKSKIPTKTEQVSAKLTVTQLEFIKKVYGTFQNFVNEMMRNVK